MGGGGHTHLGDNSRFLKQILLNPGTFNRAFVIKVDINVLPKSTGVVISNCLRITKCFKKDSEQTKSDHIQKIKAQINDEKNPVTVGKATSSQRSTLVQACSQISFSAKSSFLNLVPASWNYLLNLSLKHNLSTEHNTDTFYILYSTF